MWRLSNSNPYKDAEWKTIASRNRIVQNAVDPGMLVDIPPLNPTRNATPLSSRSWSMALLLILLGLGTFFAPLFRTDPPVLGHTYWSPLEIVMQLQEGRLPVTAYRQHEPWAMDPVVWAFALQYAPLLVALVAVAVLSSTNLLRGAAIWGALFFKGR